MEIQVEDISFKTQATQDMSSSIYSDITMTEGLLVKPVNELIDIDVTPKKASPKKKSSPKQVTLTQGNWIDTKKKRKKNEKPKKSSRKRLPYKTHKVKKDKVVNETTNVKKTKGYTDNDLGLTQYDEVKPEQKELTLTNFKYNKYTYTSTYSSNPTFVSVDYYPEPGDLIKCPAGQKKVEWFNCGVCHKELECFGVVVEYVYPNEEYRLKDEHVLVDWMPVTMRISSGVNVTINGSDRPSPIHASFCSIIAKKKKDEIVGYNGILVDEIYNNFHYLNKDKGWVKKVRM